MFNEQTIEFIHDIATEESRDRVIRDDGQIRSTIIGERLILQVKPAQFGGYIEILYIQKVQHAILLKDNMLRFFNSDSKQPSFYVFDKDMDPQELFYICGILSGAISNQYAVAFLTSILYKRESYRIWIQTNFPDLYKTIKNAFTII